MAVTVQRPTMAEAVIAPTERLMARRRWLKARSHDSRYPEMLAVALVFIMISTAGVTVWDLYRRATVETRIGLGKLIRGVAEQTYRSFQQVDLLLTDVIEYIDQAGYDASSMNGRLSHRYLADRIRGLRQVGDLMIADETGRIVNHALSWPVPDLDISDGLPENPDRQGCRIGEVGLLGVFQSCPASLAPDRVLNQICEAASIGDHSRVADDTTVICIDRRASEAGVAPSHELHAKSSRRI